MQQVVGPRPRQLLYPLRADRRAGGGATLRDATRTSAGRPAAATRASGARARRIRAPAGGPRRGATAARPRRGATAARPRRGATAAHPRRGATAARPRRATTAARRRGGRGAGRARPRAATTVARHCGGPPRPAPPRRFAPRPRALLTAAAVPLACARTPGGCARARRQDGQPGAGGRDDGRAGRHLEPPRHASDGAPQLRAPRAEPGSPAACGGLGAPRGPSRARLCPRRPRTADGRTFESTAVE